MVISRLLRCCWLLPGAWIDAIACKGKPIQDNYFVCKKWSKRAMKALGYPFVIEGKENLKDVSKVVFVSNHQGTLDPALVVASCDIPLSFISKIENEKIPILGRWATNIGTIHFDRNTREGNVSMLRETLRYLKNNQNVLLFAEGTRSKSDNMNPFKENSLKPAMMAKATIIPITLNKAYCLDRKIPNDSQLKITYHQPIPFEEYKEKSEEQLRLEVHQIIENSIEKEAVKK